jgi:hypothetical protein
MKLTTTQLGYLHRVSERPLDKPHDEDITAWWHYLWAASLIDVIGNSVHISEAGRAALDKERQT